MCYTSSELLSGITEAEVVCGTLTSVLLRKRGWCDSVQVSSNIIDVNRKRRFSICAV